MEAGSPLPLPFSLEREYTLSKIKWKRSLTEIDMKRRLAEKKEKSNMKFEVIQQIASPTLKFEVENFKLFGTLKKGTTVVHDTLPTQETIGTEHSYIQFDRQRRSGPHNVNYNQFQKSATPTPRSSAPLLPSSVTPKPQTSPSTLQPLPNTSTPKPPSSGS